MNAANTKLSNGISKSQFVQLIDNIISLRANEEKKRAKFDKNMWPEGFIHYLRSFLLLLTLSLTSKGLLRLYSNTEKAFFY